MNLYFCHGSHHCLPFGQPHQLMEENFMLEITETSLKLMIWKNYTYLEMRKLKRVEPLLYDWYFWVEPFHVLNPGAMRKGALLSLVS